MSLDKILENWSDYDNKKKKGIDSLNFSCTESWEVDYLIEKIKKNYPGLANDDIKHAIESCCNKVSVPHPRKKFIQCVLIRLGLTFN